MKDVRIWFKKHGAARFISHLDLNRTVIRALNLAKIPVWHTEGFNPHPFITFALPLSLGFTGEYECFDIRLTGDSNFDEIKDRLNAALPGGIRVYDVTAPVMKPGVISYAHFLIRLSSDNCFVNEMEEKVKELFEMDEIMVDKRSKSGIKEVDLKENICKYSVNNEDEELKIDIILPAGSVNNVNPNLIVTALEKYFAISTFADVTRVMLYNEQVEPFK